MSAIFIARLLGPTLQGEWSLYVNAFTFGLFALSLGLPSTIVNFIASGKLEKRHVIAQIFLFGIASSVVFAFLILIISSFGTGVVFLPNEIDKYIIVLGLYFHFLFLIINQLLGGVLQAEKKFVAMARINAITAIVLLALYGLLYFVFKTESLFTFTLFILLNLAILLCQLLLYLKSIFKIEEYTFCAFRLPTFKGNQALLIFASWVYLTNLLQFLNYKMDIWFINAYEVNQENLGVYVVSVSLVQLLWLVPNAFHSVVFSEVSSNANSTLINKIGLWTKRIFILSVILAVIGYFLSFTLVPLLFGEKYRGILEVIPYLLPGVILFSLTFLWSAYFAGIRRVDLNFRASFLGFIVCFALNFFLIPYYGIIGAAISTSFSYGCTALYLYWLYQRLLTKSIPANVNALE